MSVQLMIVMRGLPGSGKTTWAKAIQTLYPDKYKRISNDDIRLMMYNTHWNKNVEDVVLDVEESIIRFSLHNGFNVIIDNTHLKNSHLIRLQKIADEFGVKYSVKDFTNVPLDVCIARDKTRGSKSVGQKVIRHMYGKFLDEIIEPPIYDFNLPDCIICDLDGTLALLGNRSPYEADKCDVDSLCTEIAEILHYAKHHKNRKVMFITASPETFRSERTAWLQKFAINYDALYMRTEGDTRPDFLVKKEIYEQQILNQYNVWLVLEDRTQVVDMWRSLGLKTFQVQSGDF